jgi:hypothetical protein
MSNKLQIIFLLVISLVFIVISCAEDNRENKDILARAGERIIDWKLLNRSYHLDPKWGRGLTVRQSYENQLNFLIDQKLYAQAAIEQGFNLEQNNQKYLTFLKEKEMIKELYRQEVESQISITEEEYKTAYRNLKTQIKLDYVTTADESSAHKYLNLIKNMPFDEIILEKPETEEKGTTPYFSFGEMAEEIENVAFDLDLNETAGPLKIESKYMVIKLVDGTREVLFSEADYAESKSKIRQIIFDRRASRLSNQYISKLLRDENIKLKPEVFSVLSAHFDAIVSAEIDENPLPVNLSDSELKQVRTKIKDIRNEVLVTYNQGQMTVEEFLSRLFVMPAGLRPMVKMSQNLKLAIGIIVRDKYLAERAYGEELDRIDIVIYETEWQSDQFLARVWLRNLRAQISLTSDEIDNFKTSNTYQKILQKSEKDITSAEIEDLLKDFKFANAKMISADSLRQKYDVFVDSSALLSRIEEPDKIINQNPIKLTNRENFN